MTAYIDTSALAKCYIREQRSLEVLDWVEDRGEVATSTLVLVEFRCLLARRRRDGTIDAAMERRVLSEFDNHVRTGAWRVVHGRLGDFASARDMIDSLPAVPLRALDAIHLAAARSLDSMDFATSDRKQADAARALGFNVHDFS